MSASFHGAPVRTLIAPATCATHCEHECAQLEDCPEPDPPSEFEVLAGRWAAAMHAIVDDDPHVHTFALGGCVCESCGWDRCAP